MLIRRENNRNYTVWGISWLMFFALVSFLSYMQALMDIPVKYPVSVPLGGICCVYYLKIKCQNVRQIVFNGLGMAACIAIATLLHDFSWDGQAYHMEAVWQLANGWNIYHDVALTKDATMNAIWLNSYPKATWMFGSALYAITGSLLSCKSYILILCVANVFLLKNIISNFTDNKWWTFGITFLLVANPVVSAQLWTTYLDGALYLICLAISLLLINTVLYGDSHDCLLLAVLASAIAFNFKFTAVAYVGLVWLCYITYLFMVNRKNLLKAVVAGFISTILGLLIVGYNPYVTNFINEGHPFWPLRGSHDLINVMLSCGDEEFLEQDRFSKMVDSFLGKSSNKNASKENMEFKIPFLVYKSEMRDIISPDCRIGGFGLWFSGILIFFVIAFVIVWREKRNCTIGNLCIVSFLLVSIMINPESWVARYAPQTYVLPIISLILISNSQNTKIKKFANIFLVILMINSSHMFCVQTKHQIYDELADYKAFKELREDSPVKVWSSGMFETVFQTRFKYHDVDYVKIDRKLNEKDVEIRGVWKDFYVWK